MMVAVCITTVGGPTRAVTQWASLAPAGQRQLIVAGDRKGPASYDLPNTTFLSLQAQLEGPFELARRLPTGHYCRKNLAYLEAIRQGATCIYETDDDNAPLPSWAPREEYLRGVRLVAHESHESARRGERDGGVEEVVRQCVSGQCVSREERCGPGNRDPELTDSRTHGRTVTPSRWVNVYRYFTDALIWPRGLPLDEIHSPLPPVKDDGATGRRDDGTTDSELRNVGGALRRGELSPQLSGFIPHPSGPQAEGSAADSPLQLSGFIPHPSGPQAEGSAAGFPTSGFRSQPSTLIRSSLQLSGFIPHPSAGGAARRAPIQQGLVNGSPDVDAVWRLVLDRPFAFDDRPSVCLEPGNWCPFNTQSTWWWPVAFPLLYIPSHCSFRMCDIWKSFVAQRCLWELGLGVVFHAPEVVQERNPHDLMRDFVDEAPGYQRNRELVQVLERTRLEPGEEAVGANLLRCYEALAEAGILPREELTLVSAWLAALGWALRGNGRR